MYKILIFFLLVTLPVFAQTSTQNTNFHFYYGSSEALGAEILIDELLGFGFSGTAEESKALGEFSPGKITQYDLNQKVSTTTQKWFTLYGVVQICWIGDFQISADVGMAMYGRHANFYDANREEYYHKKDKLLFKPMLGVNLTYAITKDIGWQVGFDSFSGANTGFVIYF